MVATGGVFSLIIGIDPWAQQTKSKPSATGTGYHRPLRFYTKVKHKQLKKPNKI